MITPTPPAQSSTTTVSSRMGVQRFHTGVVL